MNFPKYVKPAVALAIAALCAVGGTLAYLQDQTEEVTNAFTFSSDNSVDIDLKEDNFGGEGNTDPVPMVPGDEIAKDPQMVVQGDDCYIYIDVTETCAINGKNFTDFIDYEILPQWEKVTTVTNNPAGTTTYVYTNNTGKPVAVSSTDTNLYILKDNKVTVKDDVTAEMLGFAKDNNPELSFIGYALQAENVTPESANASFIDAFKTPSP